MGITTEDEYKESGLELDSYIFREFPKTFCSGEEKLFDKYQGLSFSEFKEQATVNAFLTLAPYHKNVDVNLLEEYIAENYDTLISSNKKYFFRKLICYLDWLKYCSL